MITYDGSMQSYTCRMQDVSFIGGTDYRIEFPFYKNGTPLNMESCSFKWYMSPYGQPEIKLITMTPFPINNYTIALYIPSNITKSYEGLYIHQLELNDATNKTFRVAEGIIDIKKAII